MCTVLCLCVSVHVDTSDVMIIYVGLGRCLEPVPLNETTQCCSLSVTLCTATTTLSVCVRAYVRACGYQCARVFVCVCVCVLNGCRSRLMGMIFVNYHFQQQNCRFSYFHGPFLCSAAEVSPVCRLGVFVLLVIAM